MLEDGNIKYVFSCAHVRVTVFFREISFSVTMSQNVLQ